MKFVINEHSQIESLKINNTELLKAKSALFRLTLLDETGERIFLSADDFEKIGKSGNTYSFEDCKTFPKLKVFATVDTSEKAVNFGIKIENNSGLYIEKLRYPIIKTENDLKMGGRVFLPYCEGFVCDELGQGEDKRYPGLINMQFLSYYKDGHGFYFACEDEECTPKIIDCKGLGDDMDFVIETFVSISPNEIFENKSYSVIKEFEGDWQDACELYRNFTQKSKFKLPTKIADEKSLPKWSDESPVFVIYPVRSIVGVDYFGPNEYFPYINGKKYLDELKEDFGVPILSLLINWEGSAPWCPPYIWPPYGGEDAFSEFVSAMHKSGNYVGLYASGINWTDKSVFCPEYDMTEYRKKNEIDKILCQKPNGELDEEVCVRSVREGYHMCPHCKETENITYDQIEKISKFNIDYLQYFDQNLGGAPDTCYAKDHGHVPTYGKWATEDMKKIYQNIVRIMKENGSDCLLGAESSPSDMFLSELRTNDLRYIWPMATPNFTGLKSGHSVPAIQYVFHEYSLNFMGNQCIFESQYTGEDNPESLFLRLAYSFTSGDMLTVVLKSGGEIHFNWGASWLKPGPNQNETKKFIKELSKMRTGLGKEYLIYGKMLKSSPIECNSFELKKCDGSKVSYPVVFQTKWEAQNGDKAYILVNYTDKPQKVTLSENFNVVFDADEETSIPKTNTITLKPRSTIGIKPTL